MELEKKLNYEPYNHQYGKGDVLMLREARELDSINQILLANNPSCDIDSLSGISWYLTQEKTERFSEKKLMVISAISWDTGIPFYILVDMEDDDESRVQLGEFYLLN